MDLLAMIERFLARTKMPASRFGREAIGDPRFLRDLRRGRQPRPAMAARIRAFVAAHEGNCDATGA